MVVALENQVDLVFVEHRLPESTQIGIVSILGRGEDGMMKCHDGPAVRVVRQYAVEPRGLGFLVRVGLVPGLIRVQTDDSRPLEVEKVGQLLLTWGAVLGEGKLRP